MEIGLSQPAGMSVAPLSWTEIGWWQHDTGVMLDPWEARLLRSLSAAYVAESREADSETSPPPWRAPVTDADRRVEADALRMVLG